MPIAKPNSLGPDSSSSSSMSLREYLSRKLLSTVWNPGLLTQHYMTVRGSCASKKQALSCTEEPQPSTGQVSKTDSSGCLYVERKYRFE